MSASCCLLGSIAIQFQIWSFEVKIYSCLAPADELLELLKREKELGVSSGDSDPYVDAYLKANAASTPDHIATEAGHL